jgi:glyoxylase-like metal-dependent hydrolase (beta-lactamase superfamily II)
MSLPASPSPALTRRAVLRGGVCLCCVAGTSAAFAAVSADSMGRYGETGLPAALELGRPAMQRIAPDVWVAEIAPGVWLHTTTHPVGGVMYPANGLALARADGAVLIDAGWTPAHGETLLQWAATSLPKPVRAGIATHFHDDRTGGTTALRARGLPMLAHPLTVELARSQNNPVPDAIAGFGDAPFRFAEGIELWRPGGGHTRDNIVVWLAESGVLFGGCFLKSVTSPTLGNVADAVMSDWATSVTRTRARYAAARLVVPGHGTLDGDAIAATLALLAREPAAAPGGR